MSYGIFNHIKRIIILIYKKIKSFFPLKNPFKNYFNTNIEYNFGENSEKVKQFSEISTDCYFLDSIDINFEDQSEKISEMVDVQKLSLEGITLCQKCRSCVHEEEDTIEESHLAEDFSEKCVIEPKKEKVDSTGTLLDCSDEVEIGEEHVEESVEEEQLNTEESVEQVEDEEKTEKSTGKLRWEPKPSTPRYSITLSDKIKVDDIRKKVEAREKISKEAKEKLETTKMMAKDQREMLKKEKEDKKIAKSEEKAKLIEAEKRRVSEAKKKKELESEKKKAEAAERHKLERERKEREIKEFQEKKERISKARIEAKKGKAI